MCVRQECLVTPDNISWKLISLNKVRIKCIQNENIVVLRSIRKIWPIEAVSHVILVNAGA